MFEIIRESVKTILAMFLIVVLTHSLFFMAYGYFMGGDPFIALKNFYNVIYNIR